MNLEAPLVSICIPTYNGEKYLEDALNSAMNQTYTNLEIIISDDHSKDRTLDIVKKYKEETDIPIHIFHHEPNGIGANWNHCVKQSNGKYIKFLFQDDVLDEECVSQMIHLAEKSDYIGMVFCRREILVSDPNEFQQKWLKNYSELHNRWANVEIQDQQVVSGLDLLKDKKLLNGPINKIGEPTAVLLKKECFEKVGYFSLELKQYLDLEYWYRILKHYDVAFSTNKLISFRLHDDQATFQNEKNDVNEFTLFMKVISKNIFWQLHSSWRVKVFTETTVIGRYCLKPILYLYYTLKRTVANNS